MKRGWRPVRATFGVDREAAGHHVVDPSLDRARRAEVVERQAEQDRVCLLELVDELLRKLPRNSLCRRVLFGRDVPCKPAPRVEVRDRAGAEVTVGDRAAGIRRTPHPGGASAQRTSDRPFDSDARVDVKQMRHVTSR